MRVMVNSKGQVTLPADAHRRLDILHVDRSVRDLKGVLPQPDKALSLTEMSTAIATGAAGSPCRRAR